MIILLQQIILLFGTLLSGIIDAKTGYIYDTITYPMIILGIILSLISFNLFNLFSGGILFILLLIVYKLGKIGGGDVKLFTAIAFLNPTNNFIFIITIFFIAALSAMLFYSIYYFIKYLRKGINFKREKNNIYNAIIIGIAMIAYLIILSGYNIIRIEFFYFVGIIIFFGLLFMAFQKGIKEEFFEEKIKIKDLEEDEILGEKNSEKINKLIKGKNLLSKKEIEILKKNNIKSIYVLRNLPKFGPFIFFGVIFSILFPNLLNLIFL